MEKLAEKIKKEKVLVSDGAWGTMLFAKGLKHGECPESWNYTHRDDVKCIALDYIEAGAQLVKTNSFGANVFKLKNYQLEDKIVEINTLAAGNSREAVSDLAYVLGSVGPTGKFLMMGEVTFDELYESFKNQCIGLEEGGADAILIETISDLEETLCAVKAAKENTTCLVICTMTFEKGQNGEFHTMFGISPEAMVNALKEAGADMIGANCGNGFEGMIQITKEIRKIDSEIPVVIHANAGLPVYSDGKTIYPETPEDMAKLLPQLIDAGANIIGGCCGTSPAHIKAMANALKQKKFSIK